MLASNANESAVEDADARERQMLAANGNEAVVEDES